MMDWYYAQDNQQKGPVSEVDFTGLVNSRIVTEQTLVWHEGMTNWQAYGEVRVADAAAAAAPAPPVAPPVVAPVLAEGQVFCAECGRAFPVDQTIRLGTVSVCAGCKPVYVQKVMEGVTPGLSASVGGVVYGGFWIRVAAKMIDGLLLGLVLVAPMLGLLIFRTVNSPHPPAGPNWDMIGVQVLFQLVVTLGAVAYNTFMIGKYGATLGKMAMGLKVIVADGTPPTFLRAFGRAWAEQLSGLVCYIGYIIAGFDEEKRALHDHICNTRVIRKP